MRLCQALLRRRRRMGGVSLSPAAALLGDMNGVAIVEPSDSMAYRNTAGALDYDGALEAGADQGNDTSWDIGSKLTGLNGPVSVYVEGITPATTATGANLFSVDDGSGNNYFHVYREANNQNLVFQAYSGGVIQAFLFYLGPMVEGTQFRVTCRVDDNDFAVCYNGGTILKDASGSKPVSVTKINNGSLWSPTVQKFPAGSITKLLVVKEAWSDAELQIERP